MKLFVTLGLLCIVTYEVSGQQEDRINELVEQLKTGDLNERNDASHKLVQLWYNDEILDVLRQQHQRNCSVDTKVRLEVIIDKIETYRKYFLGNWTKGLRNRVSEINEWPEQNFLKLLYLFLKCYAPGISDLGQIDHDASEIIKLVQQNKDIVGRNDIPMMLRLTYEKLKNDHYKILFLGILRAVFTGTQMVPLREDLRDSAKKQAERLLKKYLDDNSDLIRLQALRIAVGLNFDKANGSILKMLKSNDVLTVQEAIRLLGKQGPQNKEIIHPYLNNSTFAQSAMFALAEIGAVEYADDIAKYLLYPSSTIRGDAIAALDRLLHPCIRINMNEEDSDRITFCYKKYEGLYKCYCYFRINTEAIPGYLNALGSRNRQARLIASYMLGLIKNQDTLDNLEEALKVEKDNEIILCMHFAIDNIKGREHNLQDLELSVETFTEGFLGNQLGVRLILKNTGDLAIPINTSAVNDWDLETIKIVDSEGKMPEYIGPQCILRIRPSFILGKVVTLKPGDSYTSKQIKNIQEFYRLKSGEYTITAIYENNVSGIEGGIFIPVGKVKSKPHSFEW